uniref:Uncharacterized protein n=1 Tax=viral metagenome TaxID=1070528 RepID=A0A6M3L9H4_9ZZZZ
MAQRLAGRYGYPKDEPFRPGTFHPDQLEKPLGWKKPRFIFVVSMGDLFHEAVSDGLTGLVFAMTIMAPQHTYLFLTKRPQNMKEHLSTFWKDEPPPANVWLGVTAEDQQRADERIPVLLSIPAAKHFVSVEPMLAEVDLDDYLPRILCSGCDKGMSPVGAVHEYWVGPPTDPPLLCGHAVEVPGLDWCIVGGETGPKARPMNPDWARSLRDQCQAAGVPFWFKKQSARHYIVADAHDLHLLDGETWEQRPCA